MTPRLQWAFLFIALVLAGAYFVLAGGDGPCAHGGWLPACHQPAAKRG